MLFLPNGIRLGTNPSRTNWLTVWHTKSIYRPRRTSDIRPGTNSSRTNWAVPLSTNSFRRLYLVPVPTHFVPTGSATWYQLISSSLRGTYVPVPTHLITTGQYPLVPTHFVVSTWYRYQLTSYQLCSVNLVPTHLVIHVTVTRLIPKKFKKNRRKNRNLIFAKTPKNQVFEILIPQLTWYGIWSKGKKTIHEPERFPKRRWGFQWFVAPKDSIPPEILGKSWHWKIIPNRTQTKNPSFELTVRISQDVLVVWVCLTCPEYDIQTSRSVQVSLFPFWHVNHLPSQNA